MSVASGARLAVVDDARFFEGAERLAVIDCARFAHAESDHEDEEACDRRKNTESYVFHAALRERAASATKVS